MKKTSFTFVAILSVLATNGCVTNPPNNTSLTAPRTNDASTEASINTNVVEIKDKKEDNIKKKNKNTKSGQQEYLLDRQSADRVCMTQSMQGTIDNNIGNAQKQAAMASTTASMSAAMPLSAMGAAPGIGLIAGIANMAMMSQAQQQQPQFDHAACINNFMEARGW